MVNEQEFLAAYDPRAYPPVAVTVDVVALTIRDGALHVLLVRRGQAALRGALGAARRLRPPRRGPDRRRPRELAEETGLGGEAAAPRPPGAARHLRRARP